MGVDTSRRVQKGGIQMNASFFEDRETDVEGRDAPGRTGERFRMTRHRTVAKRKRPKQVNGFHKRRQKRSGL